MSNRVSVLRYVVEHGPSTREAAIQAIDPDRRQALTQTFYQLVKADHLKQDGVTASPDTTYTITDSGQEYFDRNKDRPPRKQSNQHTKRQPAPEVLPAPVVPNISATAESLADQISLVFAENSELRNALVEIRSTINRLLGDQPADEDPEHGNIIEFGGEK